MHNIYLTLLQHIATSVATYDAQLNKITRNITATFQPQHISIKSNFWFVLLAISYYLCQGECSEHWRRFKRLVVLFVIPCVCVYIMTHNSNDVIAPTAQAATPAVTFPSLSPAVKRLFLLPTLSLL